ncbi:hypothetical protein COLO4_01978 [Corchorus olitorius]|uniref:Uncharacterized protein n=1 Tax=Corchorus olitorius TaxID=93759 RepID=A0A1R3L1P5_9ROSI|nr:hypothetical protein COLO4_01978 [Corchorus olitorius]
MSGIEVYTLHEDFRHDRGRRHGNGCTNNKGRGEMKPCHLAQHQAGQQSKDNLATAQAKQGFAHGI